MNKDSKRAVRRHHLARMKAKAVGLYHFHAPEAAVKYANHLTCCSCWACGNRRKYEGMSVGERRQLD